MSITRQRHFTNLYLTLAAFIIFFSFFSGIYHTFQTDFKDSTGDTPFPVLAAYSPEILFDPNRDFLFDISEKCERSYQELSWNPTDLLSFSAPPLFDSSLANITLRVRSAIETQTIIPKDGEVGSYAEQAQGFYLPENYTLVGFSVLLYGKHPPVPDPLNFSLRKDAYNGIILDQTMVTLPDGTQWQNVSVNSSLVLTPGHYYIHCQEGTKNKRLWLCTSEGGSRGNCFIKNGEDWDPQPQLWNLTLRIDVKKILDPETVVMKVSNRPVTNLGNGFGWVNFTTPIISSVLNFPVSNSSPIEFFYWANLSYYRNSQASTQVSLTLDGANWNLTGFSYPEVSFQDYKANITGLEANYEDISAFNGSKPVAFSLPPPNTTLNVSSAVDRISFTSPNCISSLEVPNEIFPGQKINLNVSVSREGNLRINIYSEISSVYQNGSYVSSLGKSFHWDVGTDLPAGNYSIEGTFFTQNQVGFFRKNFALTRIAGLGGGETPDWWIIVFIIVCVGLVVTTTYVQGMKVRSRRSVKGAIIMNQGGMTIVRKIASEFTQRNPQLVSGAVSGILSLMREITGSAIKTIELEGRYLNIARTESFVFVLLLNHKPAWINGTIKRFVEKIDQEYGKDILHWNGTGDVDIPLGNLLKKWFGVQIQEARDPEVELEMNNNSKEQYVEKISPNSS